MTELKRWLDDAPSDDIRDLLAAAQSEDAPARLLRRTLVALGTTSATAAAGASGAAAASGTSTASGASAAGGAAKLGMLGIVLKWGGAGLVSGTLVGGAVAGVTRIATMHDTSRAPTHTAPARRVPHATNPSPELPRSGRMATPDAVTPTNGSMEAAQASNDAPLTRSSAPATTGTSPTAHSASSPSLPATDRSTAAARSAPPAAFVPVLPAGPATAPEVALVDAARTALHRGEGERTLRLLSDYERRFAPVHLEPEVLYLRMQAAKLQGDRAGARRAATQIVTQFPQSPEVGRAEELLSTNGDTAKK